MLFRSIIPVHANLRVFLESLPAREIDAVVLLDSQDWMAADEIRGLWDAIDRAGKDTVRVIFRTAGAASPLDDPKLAPPAADLAARHRAQRHRLRPRPLRHLRRLSLLRATVGLRAMTG